MSSLSKTSNEIQWPNSKRNIGQHSFVQVFLMDANYMRSPEFNYE